ncbi:MAG: hypothetical protein PHX17_02260, partial [Candidatus Pacebacteria bacterium]|nr:hypothetical protein [Candidatus Paceibacterota bacterium]
SQDSTFDATTVTGGVSNAVLAKYSFKAFGENVKVSYLDVESSVNLDNVSIYVNGAPVTSNVNYTGSKLHFSLGSSLIIPAGEAVSVEVRGDTKVNGEKLTDNTNIKMTLVPYTNNAQGVSSSKMITVPSIKIEGQELTVGSGALTISKRSGVADSNISPNTDNQRIGAFTIQAGDSEAVRINNFNVNLTGSLKTESLSNLYLKYGSSETTPRSVQANNNFTAGGVVIPAGESMNVDVYADVHSVLAKPNVKDDQELTPESITGPTHTTKVIEVNGTGDEGGTITMVISGVPIAAASSTTAAAVAAELTANINANFNVSGYVTAKVDDTDTTNIILTATKPGSAGVINVTVPESAVAGITLTAGTTATGAEKSATLIVGGTFEAGDIFTAIINGVSIPYVVKATDTDNSGIATAIKDAINASSVKNVVVASHSTNTVTVTAIPGTTGLTSISGTAENGSTTSDAATVITTLGISATGVSSNATLSVDDETGQTMTTATATLNAPTLSSTSAAAQFVLGDSEAQAAKYNFIATGGKVVVNKLKFTVTNPQAIKSITVDGKTQSVGTGGVVTISGLNIEIPETRSGKAIEVKANYSKVGIGGITSIDGVLLTLNEVEYKSGNTTKKLTSVNESSNGMYVVAAYPAKVEIKKVTNNLRSGSVKVAEVTITPTGGPIQLKALPIQIDISSGASEASLTSTSKFVTKSSLLANDVETELGVSEGDVSASKTITFSTAVTITKAETFSIYVDGIKNAAKDNKLTTKLGDKTEFLFNDIEGTGTNIPGTKLLKENYDESSVEISY